MHILSQDPAASKFLGEYLLLTISALKEKYEGCSDVIRTGQQVREWVSLCVSKLHAFYYRYFSSASPVDILFDFMYGTVDR